MSSLAWWVDWCGKPSGRGTLCYYGAYLCLGMTVSQFGPVMIDLAVITGGSIRDTGFCLMARSFAYLLGAACGPVFDHFTGHPILAFAMLLCGVGTALIPSATSTLGLAATLMLQGFAMGLLDTGCNLLMLWWWAEAAGPYMQLLHCLFGMGATVGPLLLRIVESSGARDYVQVKGAGTDAAAHVEGKFTYSSAFYMSALACFAVSICFIFSTSPVARTDVAATPLPVTDVAVDLESDDIRHSKPETVKVSQPEASEVAVVTLITSENDLLERDKWFTVGTAAALLGIYVGAETGYGAFVAVYSVIELESSEARGQWLSSCFWLSITIGRFVSIWLSMALSPGTLLWLSMGLSAIVAIILVQAAKSQAGLWFVSIFFGLTMAPIFPTCLSLVESFFPVLGKYATILMIGSATGEMLIPALMSLTFGGGAEELTTAEARSNGPTANPTAMLYIVASTCVVNCGALFILQTFGKRVVGRLIK